MKKILLSSFLLLISGSKWAFSDQVSAVQFRGLNSNESSVIIDPSEAQDLLNVDVTPGGKSVKKRPGSGVYKALGTGRALHGGFHAFDSTGNDYQLWGSSRSLYGVVADATPIQLISSATLASTWDCTDTQGSSYCVNSNRDLYLVTNGTTLTWYSSPLGTMIESTPDRVVVAGVSGAPNSLYVSQSNTFTNFTTGVNNTDAFIEPIASPGSKITHIRWGCGKLLWWKDQSFGYFDFEDQYAGEIKTISDTIGTFDNTSAIDPGGQVWFRGQDGHTWKYDCSSLSKESIDITPNVQLAGKRTSNVWIQTTGTDFSAGAGVPTINITTSASPGDVTVSSFQAVENSSTQWNSGTASSVTVGATTLMLAVDNTTNITDFSFEAGVGFGFGSNWSGVQTLIKRFTGLASQGCTINPSQGSSFAGVQNAGTSETFSIKLIDATFQTLISSKALPSASVGCAWGNYSLSANGNTGRRVRLRLDYNDGTEFLTESDNFILGGTINYDARAEGSATTPGSVNYAIDNVTNGSSTITTGAFTSQTYDLGFTSSTVQLQAGYTADTIIPTFSLLTSSGSTGPFSTLLTSTGSNGVAGRYVKYVTTFTLVPTDNGLTTISSVTILARSTGTYYSAVKNAPNITAWSTLGVNQVLGGGTETFYIRSATNTFSVLSSTPTWVVQTVGGLISASTGTFFQFRDDFGLTAATQTPTLNDFTINWFEGVANDQAYMLYFDNAIWESVPFGVGQSTNNYIFKKDLINDSWTLYNFGAGGMLAQANVLYFGGSGAADGNIYNYGTSTSDNGTAINAFWKSKDYTGPDPFLQVALNQIDVFAVKDQGTSLTATYTMDTSTAVAYSVNLSTSNAIVQSRKILPSGKLGYAFNYKFGDTSASSDWEVLGYRMMFTPQSYRPGN